MMPRNLGALFCGIAAVALLVAGFMPWFATENSDELDYNGDTYSSRSRYIDVDDIDDVDDIVAMQRRNRGEDTRRVKGNFGLVSGELCLGLQCTSARYTGAKGLADDVFAWLGRATLAAVLSGVALLIATALAARQQRRPILRGWAVSIVGAAAGLGAAFASIQNLGGTGYIERGMGLSAVIVGAALAGLGTAVPWGPPSPANVPRRAVLTSAIVVLALIAWFTLLQHAWWRSGRTLDVMQVSPLGVEVCDGGDCRLASSLGATTLLRALACLTSLCTAALIAPAFGAASRIARGVSPGAWGWAAAAIAWLGFGLGLATWASYPAGDIMTVGWGLPLFAVAMAGAGGAAIVGTLLFKTADAPEAVVIAPAASPAAQASAGIAPGAKPVLAALGGAAPAPTVVVPLPANVPTVEMPVPTSALPTLTIPVPRAADPAFVTAPMPVPAPLPQAKARPAAAGASKSANAAALLAKRTSPMCPNCRIATLWHGKRAAWWCSTCKQTV